MPTTKFNAMTTFESLFAVDGEASGSPDSAMTSRSEDVDGNAAANGNSNEDTEGPRIKVKIAVATVSADCGSRNSLISLTETHWECAHSSYQGVRCRQRK